MATIKQYAFLLILTIFLIKEPFELYLLAGGLYKLFYAVVFIFALSLYNKLPWHYITIEIKLYYSLFIFIFLLVAFRDPVKFINNIQFLISILTFFALYILVIKIKNELFILNILNKLAIVLAVFSLITIFILYFNINIFPIIIFYPVNAKDGFEFLFPFSFLHNGLGEGLKNYRSYSYFSEPAKFSYFIVPFIFYNYTLFKDTKKVKYAIYSLSITVALFTTLSIAGIGAALFLVFLYAYLFSSKKNIKGLIFYIIVILFLLLAYQIIEDKGGSILERRLMAIISRWNEWSIFIDTMVKRPFGYGIGHTSQVMYVWSPLLDTYVTYASSVTNVLLLIQSFGILFLIPLIIFILLNIKIIRDLYLYKNNIIARLLIIQIISGLIFSVSLNLIFSPISLLYLVISIYFIKNIKQKRGVKV
jgi:hypothetical protein